MKHHLIVVTAAALSMAACTQLGEEDRALLMETRAMAKEAKEQSILAADSAARSAAAAKASSDKADRIFRQSQNK